jgi:multisubunit Na+/H+ antiporter MnhC subunit
MRDSLKNISSLIFAILILLGILFLPDTRLKPITSMLNFLSKGNNTAYAFGGYLIQKILTGAIIILVTIGLYRVVQKRRVD